MKRKPLISGDHDDDAAREQARVAMRYDLTFVSSPKGWGLPAVKICRP